MTHIIYEDDEFQLTSYCEVYEVFKVSTYGWQKIDPEGLINDALWKCISRLIEQNKINTTSGVELKGEILETVEDSPKKLVTIKKEHVGDAPQFEITIWE